MRMMMLKTRKKSGKKFRSNKNKLIQMKLIAVKRIFIINKEKKLIKN
jgi:hypothetical protein